MQVLRWAQVKWPEGDPNSARYQCEHCEALWDDTQRGLAMVAGEWIPQKKFNGNVSYQLNQLYSRLAPLADGVRDFLDAKGNPELMKTWVNTFLGETWIDEGERLEWSMLRDRAEEYDTPVPEDVTLITAGVDIQGDRIEIEHVGWGDDYRSWSLDYRVIYGDTSAPEVWAELRGYLQQTRMHPVFGEMGTQMTCVDSGYRTSDVYKFCRSLPLVVPTKGLGGDGKPMVGKPSKNNLQGTQVFPLGVNTIKDIVVSRLKSPPGQAGYSMFPKGRSDDYFRGLTVEERRTRFVKGHKIMEWWKPDGARNEPFDLRVYATAGLQMLNVDLNAYRLRALREVEKRAIAEKNPPPKKQKQRPGRNWIDGWKHD